MLTERKPWGRASPRCVYCGKTKPRVIVAAGFAHRRCIPKPPKRQAPRPGEKSVSRNPQT